MVTTAHDLDHFIDLANQARMSRPKDGTLSELLREVDRVARLEEDPERREEARAEIDRRLQV